MHSNVLPAIIIAASILICSLVLRHEVHSVLSFSAQGFVDSIATIANAKTDDGDSVIQNSFSQISEDLSSGISIGFKRGSSQTEEIIDLAGIEVQQVTFTNGRMDNQEKIIGILANTSDVTYTNISLSVIVKDENGKLIDVINNFTKVNGTLAPGKQLGFAVDREYRPFGEEHEKEGTKGSAAEVTIIEAKIVK